MLLRQLFAIGALFPLVLFTFASAQAQLPKNPQSRADCERLYMPKSGQFGKDVIWVPTSEELVSKMLKMANTTADDFVIDLGAGDGRIVIAAAKEFGARGRGIEYEPKMVEFANCMAQVEKVTDKVEIRQGDIFKEDFGQATVITMYLLPSLNLCVRHRLLELQPGTRITSHSFTLGDWPQDDKTSTSSSTAFLWIVPARVGGTWNFREADSPFTFSAHLRQTFQKIEGETTVRGAKQDLLEGALSGDEIRLRFSDDKNAVYTLTGIVRGNQITGDLQTAGGAKTRVTGIVQDKIIEGDWTKIESGCAHYYD